MVSNLHQNNNKKNRIAKISNKIILKTCVFELYDGLKLRLNKNVQMCLWEIKDKIQALFER